jgi:signal transduction histidine kinase
MRILLKFQSGCFIITVIAAVIALLSIFILPENAECQNNPVKIGVLANQGNENCLEQWSPTAEYLSTNIPGTVFMIVPLDSDELQLTVEKGDVDFIITNPFCYVKLESSNNVQALATIYNLIEDGASTVYGSVIFCRSDREDIIEIDNLTDKTFMSLYDRPMSSWAMVLRLLKVHHIDPYKDFKEVRSSDSEDDVVYSVRDGEVDAGSVITNTLERMDREGKIDIEEFKIIHKRPENEKLPILHSTKLYPEWPLAKAEHTTDTLAEKVTLALLEITPENPAAAAGKYAGWTMNLNYQPVHECLEELRFEPYDHLLNITMTDILKHYWHWFVVVLCLLLSSIIAVVLLTYFNKKLLVYQDRLRSLSSELSLTAEKERRQIAVELHEQICQILAFSKINIEKALKLDDTGDRMEPLVNTRALIEEAMDATKSIVFTLSPPILYDLGFETALEWLSRSMIEKYGIKTDVVCKGMSVLIEKDTSIVLFHAVRELLINAVKHARATRITVSLDRTDNRLQVYVEDNGIGFKSEAPKSGTEGNNGFGLFSIQERIIYLGEKFKVKSEPGHGTKATIVLPVKKQTEKKE